MGSSVDRRKGWGGQAAMSFVASLSIVAAIGCAGSAPDRGLIRGQSGADRSQALAALAVMPRGLSGLESQARGRGSRDCTRPSLPDRWGSVPTRAVTVPLVFYNVRGAREDVDPTLDQLERQVDILNEAFCNTVFQFRLALGPKPIYNPILYDPDLHSAGSGRLGRADGDVVKAYLKNDRDELTVDIYLTSMGGGMLGYASNPLADGGLVGKRGGMIVLRHTALPGGGERDHDDGDVLVHEMGHYLGLYHTFEVEGSCTDSDWIEDTRPQESGTKGCPTPPTESCGSPDMVDNYMDYSTDKCRSSFTDGQIRAMTCVTDLDRSQLLAADKLLDQKLSDLCETPKR